MWRAVKETNKLSGKMVYIIEKRKKWFGMVSWTRELGLDVHQRGPVGAPTLDGAKYKLQMIKDNDGKMLHTEII